MVVFFFERMPGINGCTLFYAQLNADASCFIVQANSLPNCSATYDLLMIYSADSMINEMKSFSMAFQTTASGKTKGTQLRL